MFSSVIHVCMILLTIKPSIIHMHMFSIIVVVIILLTTLMFIDIIIYIYIYIFFFCEPGECCGHIFVSTMFARLFVILFDVLSDRGRFTHLLTPSYIKSYHRSKSVHKNFDNFCIVYMSLRYFRLV